MPKSVRDLLVASALLARRQPADLSVSPKGPIITPSVVREAAQQTLNVALNPSTARKAVLDNLPETMNTALPGFEKLVQAVHDRIWLKFTSCRVDRLKPLAGFLFAGTSSADMVAFAKMLAKCFFGSDQNNFLRIDCGAYSTRDGLERLLDKTPRGRTGQANPFLSLKTNREQVVLFDHIDQTCDPVRWVLGGVLDRGDMDSQTSHGVVQFRDTIVIATTTLDPAVYTNEDGLALSDEAVTRAVHNDFKFGPHGLGPELMDRFASDPLVFPLASQ